jgi:hypothetical protein
LGESSFFKMMNDTGHYTSDDSVYTTPGTNIHTTNNNHNNNNNYDDQSFQYPTQNSVYDQPSSDYSASDKNDYDNVTINSTPTNPFKEHESSYDPSKYSTTDSNNYNNYDEFTVQTNNEDPAYSNNHNRRPTYSSESNNNYDRQPVAEDEPFSVYSNKQPYDVDNNHDDEYDNTNGNQYRDVDDYDNGRDQYHNDYDDHEEQDALYRPNADDGTPPRHRKKTCGQRIRYCCSTCYVPKCDFRGPWYVLDNIFLQFILLSM